LNCEAKEILGLSVFQVGVTGSVFRVMDDKRVLRSELQRRYVSIVHPVSVYACV